ncbi:MAG: hypothetical protein K2X38_18150 [Gemmataceae bacterium]|nr:hypothetical protein [Gemmataceae bacterium]
MLFRLIAFAVAFLAVARLWAVDPDATRWEKTIERFELQDKKSPPKEGGIVFTGSSSIALWKDLEKHFPKMNPINRGFGGSSLPEVNAFVERIVTPYKPHTVVLFCGGNDMAIYKRKPEQLHEDFKTFVAKVHAKLPETKIVYLSIHTAPSRVNLKESTLEANRLIAKECAGNAKLRFVDIHDLMLGSDGKPNPELYRDALHPNEKAYEMWAEKLRRSLEK